ncbi:MAG: YicC/YloC family endoribonuclease [Ruminococcus sp.]|nr:YicC/YloC family endoribonuclease [Ruminococcus sp.]
MVKSMTGFGREHIVANGREIIVEIRSVNHRYYEFNSRTPRAYGYLDEKLKTFLKSGISRGKVEVSVSIYNQEGTDAEIELNKPVAKGYLDALRNAADELDLDDDLVLSNIIRLPDVFTVVKKTEDEEVIWNEVKAVAQTALDRFVEMRTVEGVKMYEDISGRLDYIEETVGRIEAHQPSVAQSYSDKLYAKIMETLGSAELDGIDKQRVLTEVAIFADKVAIDEETVRLRSHISQFRELIKSDEPVGRKLDFLVQEVNREVNTIGSKANDLTITKMVVDLKAEIEKIREQIQNIE